MRYAGLIILALLGGCAGYNVGATRRAQANALIGQSEADLVRALGVPTRTIETEGRRFLAYEDRRLDILPGFGGGYAGFGYGGFHRFGGGFGLGAGFPDEIVERGCDTTFELSGGRVQAYTLRGNACG